MNVVERLARWWAHRRLAAGQCSECRAVLRDDAPPHSTCSQACEDERNYSASLW